MRRVRDERDVVAVDHEARRGDAPVDDLRSARGGRQRERAQADEHPNEQAAQTVHARAIGAVWHFRYHSPGETFDCLRPFWDGGFWAAQQLPWAPMSEQIILTLRRLVKRYPPDRTVLDGITLAFLHGAKIGVLGANGRANSLPSWRASTRTSAAACCWHRRNGRHVTRSPSSSTRRAVYERRDERARTRDLLDRFNAIPRAGGRSTPTRWSARWRDRCRAHRRDRRLEPGAPWPPRWRCAFRPGRPRSHPSGGERRRVALCRLLLQAPDLLLLDRRTTSTPNRWRGSALSRTIHAPSSRSPTATSSTTSRLDPRADRGGHPAGATTRLAEQKQSPLALEEKGGWARRRARREMEWTGMSQKARQARARRACSAGLLAEEANVQSTPEIHIPRQPPKTWWSRPRA
jgi:hypothetical protein